MLHGELCPLEADADVIVLAFPHDDPVAAVIVAGHRQVYPAVPVLALPVVPKDSVARVLIDAVTAGQPSQQGDNLSGSQHVRKEPA